MLRAPYESVDPESLTFDATNWNTAQTVRVTAQDDDIDQPGSVHRDVVNIVNTAANYRYTNEGLGTSFVATVKVTVEDNDIAGVVLSKSQLTIVEHPDPTATPTARATYTVVLTSEPNRRRCDRGR